MNCNPKNSSPSVIDEISNAMVAQFFYMIVD